MRPGGGTAAKAVRRASHKQGIQAGQRKGSGERKGWNFLHSPGLTDPHAASFHTQLAPLGPGTSRRAWMDAQRSCFNKQPSMVCSAQDLSLQLPLPSDKQQKEGPITPAWRRESWLSRGLHVLGAERTLDWVCPPLSQLSLGVTAQLVSHTGACPPPLTESVVWKQGQLGSQAWEAV